MNTTLPSLTDAEASAGIPLTSRQDLAWVMSHHNALLVIEEIRQNKHSTGTAMPTLNGNWTVRVETPSDGVWWAA